MQFGAGSCGQGFQTNVPSTIELPRRVQAPPGFETIQVFRYQNIYDHTSCRQILETVEG